MSAVRFSWDEQKNLSNRKKHGIYFEEASGVFLDQRAIVYDDPEHSLEEDRFIIMGFSKSSKLLVVCYCYPEACDEEVTTVRIISARKATNKERKTYEKGI